MTDDPYHIQLRIILSDLSTRKRHDTLWLALGFVLQDITGDSTTQDIEFLLRQRLGYPASEAGSVMTWLTRKAAPLIPEAAQTGAVVKAYGRYGRKWVWAPRRRAPTLAAVMGKLEAGLNAAGVVDTRDW